MVCVGRSIQQTENQIKKPKVSYEFGLRRRIGSLARVTRSISIDRIVIYRGIELRGLCMYVVVAYERGSAYATEAGLKYFVIGAVASGRFLYGRIRIYLDSGSFNRNERKRRYSEGNVSRMAGIGRAIAVGVITYKVGMVPGHLWVADVYEGATTEAAIYLSSLTKRVWMIVILRRREVASWFDGAGVGNESIQWMNTLRSRSCARSIRVGALGVLKQRRWKRVRSYSGILNVGQLGLGVVSQLESGIQAVFRYGRVYQIMSRRIWACLATVQIHQRERKYIVEREGLGKENGARMRTLGATRMSMVGVPPRAGFLSKMRVYRTRRESQHYLLAGFGVIFSTVGAYNYLRMFKLIHFDRGSVSQPRNHSLSRGNRETLGLDVEFSKGQAMTLGRRRRRIVERMMQSYWRIRR